MFFIILAVVAVCIVVAVVAHHIYKETEPILGVTWIQNLKRVRDNNGPLEKKGTVEIKHGNEKKTKVNQKQKPFLIPDSENSEVRHRKRNDSKKDDVKKVEVREEKKKPNKNDNKITKRDYYEKFQNNANSKKEMDTSSIDENNLKDEKEIKKKVSSEIRENKKLRERLRKSAPVCPKNKSCLEPNCKNECTLLCSECNIHLCNDCYEKKNQKSGIHCIETETMQKILNPIICSIDKTDNHRIDCFLRKCKHVFHKTCLVANYKVFKKCLLCVDEGSTGEFKLSDISTDFFDPTKNVVWKSYPLVPVKKEE